MTLIDSAQRKKATDPTASFIVQAPAGSGKTEILTQRYLRLLSTVSSPEQIVALTFTRKAASEMRERIIHALQSAHSGTTASNPHQQMTLDFAQRALAQNDLYQWDILQQPNRLKINTIDSLCQSINHAIPLLEKQIAYSQITDKPNSCYLNAARQCIQFAIENPEYQHAIKTLLLHVDNRQDRLLELFRELLAQRDQWLSLLFQARTQDKSTFEEALALIENHELSRLKNSLPISLSEELTRLSRELATIENNPESPRYPLKNWDFFSEINQETCVALCNQLLGSDSNFRAAFDHHVGLKKDLCSKEQFQCLKEASKELLAQLNEYPEFLSALLQVSNLPNPEYNPEQWETLQALFILLPLLVGHLHVYFSEHNEVDFTAISQQALGALGDYEHPTDLALYLDNAIHHLLVDEFQDTSITQFELVSKLVEGWQPGDGKTLFIVGDPMQSIYRFRQAEVGLFFRAKEQGIGPVTLNSLELQCNFRSTQSIVDWVNSQFSQIFPRQFDIESGAVSFHHSVNIVEDDKHSAIHAFEFEHRQQESQAVVEIIKNELNKEPEQSIAILVRSRSQLAEIITMLREHQIPYQGTDIDLLTHLTHLRDVWSLTQALLAPGNRLSWLAVLHSPYCGLALSDIHVIAQYNKKKSIYYALLSLENIPELSEEGRIRANFFIKIMHDALSQRYQNRLSDWLRKTLKMLHIDAILEQVQLDDLEQFWTLVDRYEHEGRIEDMSEFATELSKLYSQQTTPSRVQVMTIHKSKGLEFDTVILPGLGSQPRAGNNPMLRWLKIPTQNQGNLLLVSPIQAAHQEDCALYHYLKQLDEEKSFYESQRLLYVAVTRAKSRLYLLDCSTKSYKKSFRNLLRNQEFIEQEREEKPKDEKPLLPLLKKLPLEFYLTLVTKSNQSMNSISAGLSTSTPRLIGIVTHQLLQWICDHHPENPSQIPWELAQNQLKKLGFDSELINSALITIKEQLANIFNDPIGIWIIAKQEQEHNEYELLVEHQNNLVTRIIDRTFEYENNLWIIDFKTGKESAETIAQHQQQLNQYGSYLSSRTSKEIRCGLYYLANSHWVNWDYNPVNHLECFVKNETVCD